MTEETNKENPTDSMIEDEVEETSIDPKHKNLALGNLIAGYRLFSDAFVLLLIFIPVRFMHE